VLALSSKALGRANGRSYGLPSRVQEVRPNMVGELTVPGRPAHGPAFSPRVEDVMRHSPDSMQHVHAAAIGRPNFRAIEYQVHVPEGINMAQVPLATRFLSVCACGRFLAPEDGRDREQALLTLAGTLVVVEEFDSPSQLILMEPIGWRSGSSAG